MENWASGLRKEVAKMNKEMLSRMKTAGEYQRKAVRALFPEKVGKHLDVIEKEIKMMLLEMAADVVEECRKMEPHEKEQGCERASGVKKVDITFESR